MVGDKINGVLIKSCGVESVFGKMPVMIGCRICSCEGWSLLCVGGVILHVEGGIRNVGGVIFHHNNFNEGGGATTLTSYSIMSSCRGYNFILYDIVGGVQYTVCLWV